MREKPINTKWERDFAEWTHKKVKIGGKNARKAYKY